MMAEEEQVPRYLARRNTSQAVLLFFFFLVMVKYIESIIFTVLIIFNCTVQCH